MTVRVMVADDHPLFREAIVHLLKRSISNVTVDETSSMAQLKASLHNNADISLLLLDLKFSDTNGIDGLLYIKKTFPSIPVIVISAYDDLSVIQDSLRYGASGFIPKQLGLDDIATAIQAVLDGDMWFPDAIAEPVDALESSNKMPDFASLTATQLKVLTLLRDGKPSKEMADLMSVTEATIKAHLTEIFRKLKVRNRTQAVVIAKQLDLPEQNLDE
ncbi:MAG: DNA-binding NarL/FixJ family response regulator [Planctomycetota bacterium]|jgi:DNA-binding NarL/FixJ family response regulator